MDPQDNPPTNPGANPPADLGAGQPGAPGAGDAPGAPYGQRPAWEQPYGQPPYGQPGGQPIAGPQAAPPPQPYGTQPYGTPPPYSPPGQPQPGVGPQPYGQLPYGQPQYPMPYGQPGGQAYIPPPGAHPGQQAAPPPRGGPPPQGPPQGPQGPQGQYQQGNPVATFDHSLVTSAFELPLHTIVRNYGLVRGIIVRSRSIFGQIGASFQQMAGGNISLYTEMCERARMDAYEIMIQHAAQIGANAIIAVRYDATEITSGVTEVLCYGTAVAVVPSRQAPQAAQPSASSAG